MTKASKFLTSKFTMKIFLQWIRSSEKNWRNYNGVQVTGPGYWMLRDPNKIGLLPEGTFEYESDYNLSENQLPYYWWITAGAFNTRKTDGAIYYKKMSPPYRSQYS